MVETAVSIPLLLFVVLVGLELAWAVSKKVEVTTAARIAARVASLPDATTGDVLAATSEQMAFAGFSDGDWSLEFESGAPGSAEPGQIVRVHIAAQYGPVSLAGLNNWLPLPQELHARAVMRKEGAE